MKDLSNENVIHVKKDGIEFLQFRRLLDFSDTINHAYSLGVDRNYITSKNGKISISNEELKETEKNYKDLTSAINTKFEHLIKTGQNHTKNVKIVEEKGAEVEFYPEKYKDTDGLITDKKDIILSTSNADCILLLFFDPVKKVIANTHSGWKGTLQRISVETVKKMQEEYNCDPKDIICCMCPSIRKCHFEVEKDVMEDFANEFKELDGFIEEKVPGKKWNVDTIYINKEILKNAGLQENNIIDSKLCSVCNSDQIHSFRVEGENYGLATAIIELKD